MKNLMIVITGIIIMIGVVIAIMGYREPAQIIRQLFEAKNIPKQLETEKINEESSIDYSLQNDQLAITYDKGKSWIPVPVEKDQLFDGEYNGNKQELIDNSYILTKNKAAFLYGDNKRILLTYSLDQGKTWHDATVVKQLNGVRFRKVKFLDDNFGYVIISGDRTMSQEYSTVFLTHDDGKSWHETKNSGVTRLISDGGFIDEATGFLSYGIINPEEPDFYVTQDGGKSWTKAKINIPSQYDKIFVTAEMPIKEGNHLAVLVNQGPNGDYEGGKVKGKFISKDNGLTWKFSTEVKPTEAGEG